MNESVAINLEERLDLKPRGIVIVDTEISDNGVAGNFRRISEVIGRSTRSSARKIWNGTKSLFRYILKKLDEGADMHNRQRALSEGYRNHYVLR